jgi:hypothetical protein
MKYFNKKWYRCKIIEPLVSYRENSIFINFIEICHFLSFLTIFDDFGVPGAIPENRPSIQPGFSVDLSGSNAGLKTQKNAKNR